ncbi:MAG: BPSS1187 family protein [Gemmatimonadales bacterium]
MNIGPTINLSGSETGPNLSMSQEHKPYVEDRMGPLTRVVGATAAVLLLAGCEHSSRPVDVTAAMSAATAEPAPLVPRIIAPQATDPAIDWVPTVAAQFNHHYVWLDPSREPNGKLFVLLPGTTAPSRAMIAVHQEAARLGYHVIGLNYQNGIGLNVCSATTDPACAGNGRFEILDGIDRSPFVAVSPANGIDNRLTKLLLYLEAQYPDEGWSQFLKDGAPKWNKIAVGGHSDGAGAAALIGRIRHVCRVAMLSGPGEQRLPDELVAWAFIGETPASKYFALFHQREVGVPGILARLGAFDMLKFGAPVSPELSEPPYDDTHILITDVEPIGGYSDVNSHRSTALTNVTPLGPDGTPLLREAWRYLLGAPDGGP